MREWILRENWIRGKSGGDQLTLRSFEEDGDHVVEGVIEKEGGYWYPIIGGVPCFLRGVLRPDFGEFAKQHGLPPLEGEGDKVEEAQEDAQGQALTNITFSDKWRRFTNYGFEGSHREFLFGWYCKKFGLESAEDLEEFYGDRELTLEVGPGSGFNSRFMAENSRGQVFAVDISQAVFTTFENTRDLANCHVIQADLMDTPFPDEIFDLIVADGVLHHTPNTKDAVSALYRKLKPGGQFFFYVYKKMGPARQFCDRFIRQRFSKLHPEECYAACEPLTELGRELSRLHAEITLTEPIPILGIPAGTHDVQRLIYYNFLKCFWNEAFDFETNNMVNFDWYHPHSAWQHTEAEVEAWLKELGVQEFTFHPANPNGISALLRKPA